MFISYEALWNKLIDLKISKKQLSERAGISKGTVNRMVKGENVSTDILKKICEVLDCDICDIVSCQKEVILRCQS